VLTLESAPITTPPLKVQATMVVPVCGWSLGKFDEEPARSAIIFILACASALRDLVDAI
jgi:hypothetical protein